MTKPAEIDQIYESLISLKDILPSPPLNPMAVDRVNWEHIQRFLFNVREMYLKLQEDLECIEERFKEFLINTLQDNS